MSMESPESEDGRDDPEASEAGDSPEDAVASDPGPDDASRPNRKKLYRLVAVAALLGGLFVIAKTTGVTDQVTVENMRGWMADAGGWGVLLFVVIFLVGELMQVPGLIFVAAAVLSYGRFWGGGLSYITAVLSVCFSFVVVRTVGGKALGEIKQAWVRKALAKLDTHPIKTVAVLRTVLIMSPPLNYALALTNMKFRDYLIGSAVGLVPPILVFVIFFDQLMVFFGY
jgi:uncharacterized membrane protein YdjX (TVP38/TMEM64 family)